MASGDYMIYVMSINVCRVRLVNVGFSPFQDPRDSYEVYGILKLDNGCVFMSFWLLC